MSIIVAARNMAGEVTITISGPVAVCFSLSPEQAIEMCGDIARAAADAEVWLERTLERVRVQAHVEAQRALATVGCAVCASFGRGCCRDHREATS